MSKPPTGMERLALKMFRLQAVTLRYAAKKALKKGRRSGMTWEEQQKLEGHVTAMSKSIAEMDLALEGKEVPDEQAPEPERGA